MILLVDRTVSLAMPTCDCAGIVTCSCRQALDVQSGVAVFAGEFASVMAGAGSAGGEFERLVATLVIHYSGVT